jgi:hypothetical protein
MREKFIRRELTNFVREFVMNLHVVTPRLGWKACLTIALLSMMTIADCWLTPAAVAQTYSFRTVQVPGAASTQVFRSNNFGEMAGNFGTTEISVDTSFLLAKGVFTPIVLLSGSTFSSFTFAQGINNRAQVIGLYTDSDGFAHGFLWSRNGKYIVINVPGAFSSEPASINDAGVVAGYYDDGNRFHGFLAQCGPVSCGNFTTVDFPGAVGSIALGINDAGQIVGAYSLSDPYVQHARHGFLRDTNQSFATVDFPGAIETLAWGLNNSADIAGPYLDNNNAFHGFTRIGGVYATLDFPGAAETEPTGINDHQQVVGSYSFVSSHLTLDFYGFVATPTGNKLRSGNSGPARFWMRH